MLCRILLLAVFGLSLGGCVPYYDEGGSYYSSEVYTSPSPTYYAGGVPTTPMVAVITHRRPGTTRLQRATTSRHRAITHSRGSINRRAITRSRGCINPRAITSRPLVTISRLGVTTACIRTMAGTAVAAGAGTTTIAVTTVAAITLAEAATDNMS